ncbi:ABC transporter ATP-binding protein [Streptomyces sp. NPDC057486]|uniref:ABC transporter ATP-binding protein n=1 Tax=Streptomyces sp. NPDC057486 TaxID=3346145 RepID=UPI0036A58814
MRDKADELLIDVRDLSVAYESGGGLVTAVDRVSFTLHPGEILGLAGESGCGKSTIALALPRLLRSPAVITGGQVVFDGTDLLGMDDTAIRAVRWRDIALVFQNAMNALNPVLRLSAQMVDVIRHHDRASAEQARERAGELLDLVGIGRDRLRAYPHQLSGGMRQRAAIAIALALRPRLVILDEPTTALDVVVQREILDELKGLQRELGFAVLFVSHDLELLAEFTDRIAIMYAGRLVESAPSLPLLDGAAHPYTRGLLAAAPDLHGRRSVSRTALPGTPPDLSAPPPGCRFAERCEKAMDVCRWDEPPLRSLNGAATHVTACHLYSQDSQEVHA